jgi:hypothetical protein
MAVRATYSVYERGRSTLAEDRVALPACGRSIATRTDGSGWSDLAIPAQAPAHVSRSQQSGAVRVVVHRTFVKESAWASGTARETPRG